MDFFAKQKFRWLNQSERLKMLDKIEVCKRATLMRFDPKEPAKAPALEVQSSTESASRDSAKFGFTDDDMESESTKSFSLSDFPEDQPIPRQSNLKEMVFSERRDIVRCTLVRTISKPKSKKHKSEKFGSML